jgi:hypothetical protein
MFPRLEDEKRLLAAYAAEDAGEAVRPEARTGEPVETAA